MAITEQIIRSAVGTQPNPTAPDESAGEVSVDGAEGAEASTNLVAPEIAPNDPIIGYLQGAAGAVDLTHLDLDSQALRDLRESGVTMVVPLIANGELIGVLNVGRRLSDQDYSADDRRLLETLAAHAAPAMRVGQLVREQQAEMQQRGRMEQELQVAQMIQKNFLPKSVPELHGWQLAADYRPARAVGGDFYDFIELFDGRIGLVIGDVTDKGIPAAMVMAATKSLLRASAQRLIEPGDVLARVNDQLCPEIPENMFVTCFYGVLDPATGRLVYANAGHNLPLVQTGADASELRATGMPLGLMPAMDYREQTTTLEPGARVLLYSDGLVEAHNPGRDMFGEARSVAVLQAADSPNELLEQLLAALDQFTGETTEQEDDITLVALRRTVTDRYDDGTAGGDVDRYGRVLADFKLGSAPGHERDAMRLVAEALAPVGIEAARMERLKAATAEATMNAMEHGNHYDPALDVRIVVAATDSEVTVRISDHGTAVIAPVETPDIEAKLEGLQSPRGWGLFLIKEMVDEVRQSSEDGHHAIELAIKIEGAQDAADKP